MKYFIQRYQVRMNEVHMYVVGDSTSELAYTYNQERAQEIVDALNLADKLKSTDPKIR